MFLGLSADLSDVLETDDVDLVDLHAVSPALAAAIFEHGVLLVGTARTPPSFAATSRHTTPASSHPATGWMRPWTGSTTTSATAILESQPRARQRTTDDGRGTAGESPQPDSSLSVFS